MIRIIEDRYIGRPSNVRVYLRPRRSTLADVAQHCGWVYDGDESFPTTGIRSIRCMAPVYYEFGGRNRPTYYCKVHGDFIIARLKSPKDARKRFPWVNRWRGRCE